MNARTSNRGLTATYKAVHRQISALLYEVDPWGVGSTVGSPSDEYDEAAARLIPILLRPEVETSVHPGLDGVPPDLTKRLRDLVKPLQAGDIRGR